MATDSRYVDNARPLQIGVRNISDGETGQPLRGGSYGELIVGQLGGKYNEWCRRGYVYAGIGAAAAAVPIATTLTNAPSIWNPANSGKLVVPIKVQLSLGAVGTPILQGFTLSYLVNAGSAIGTADPVVTWTNIAPVNLLLGKGSAATTLHSGAVSTYTVNPARLMDLGFGHHLEGTAASGQLYSKFEYAFDGELMLPPGATLHLGSTIATSTTYWATWIFAELPMPAFGF
jgi:hypothetical protein